MAGTPWTRATTGRLAVAVALSLLAVALVATLVLQAALAGRRDPGTDMVLAAATLGWVAQAIVTAVALGALPFVWRWVRRADREQAWRDRPPAGPEEDDRPRHRGLSGEEPPPQRW